MKFEYEIVTPLEEFPEWTHVDIDTGSNEYDTGSWTYSHGYVFVLLDNYLSYRIFIDTEELDNTDWKWHDIDIKYTDKTIDPIIYVMEDVL